ncbi:MAG: hypothetical protein J6C19_01575 [Lachnospiraceae bacterium]|nr:hypothetical protein [Lachnospiraceae bacterium]MBO5144210.1 hypothetical protein [Lachnospiraceae bacterium]
MNNGIKEINFTSLKNDFDKVCGEVNDSREAVALTLKSGRKVFIMPEENYDNISRFVMVNASPNTLTSK